MAESRTLIIDSLGVIETSKDGKSGFTPEGGFVVKLTNKSGANSVKGELVIASVAQDNAVASAGANDIECFGVFYEGGMADGSEVWIVIGGIAEILFDATGTTRGNWVGTGATAKRGDGSNGSPPAAPTHFQEFGHVIESAGANSLGKCIIHFN